MLTGGFGSRGAVSGEHREGARADFGRNSELTVGLVENERGNEGRLLVGLSGRWPPKSEWPVLITDRPFVL